MRRNLALGVFTITVVGTLALLGWTWRPWDAGATDRITTSGLVPVLTLLLGQLSALAITGGESGSGDGDTSARA